jgi:hypothetical protein
MEITSIKKIDEHQKYLNDIFTNNEKLLGGYSKYKIPDMEEVDYYEKNVSNTLIKKIWEKNNDSIRNYMESLRKQNNKINKEEVLKKFKFVVPQIKSSSLLLIKGQVVAGMNYKAIVSILFNNIPYGINTEYYEIEYFVPLN